MGEDLQKTPFREEPIDTHRATMLTAENMKTIFAYALHRVSDREDAEDLAGDIVVAVLENAHTLQNDDAFFGWFWSVAANTVKKYYRKKSRRVTAVVEDIPAEGDISDGLIGQEEVSLLRRELSLLAREYRECTVAYYFDGLSCRQIGEKYGISVEMVKYYLYKTRRILKEGLTMTRAYGEKSYKPAEFYFGTIFSGAYNAEYRNLFNRKLPGNILYCAYYTPVTLQELSLEL
ncbi:MAG: sigma-70 family RNA polymerase sigma factor, partial [Clostridia bacterium]|nr:sigma-70 family RNA polymerase sigma factor [Clostridia bacterium]